jgi:hypothetical protein
VSGLCYYRIEQFFRSGDLDSRLKKARFQIMMLVRLLALGEEIEQFNSNKIEKRCEEFKSLLLDEKKALTLFNEAVEIFENSGIDKDKRQYKSESETELLLTSYRNHIDK